MRPDNLKPKIEFEGRNLHVRFKYSPTQEEFDAAMVILNNAMEYANKKTGEDIHIIGWDTKEES